jgi:hypothetical protein
MGACVKTPTKRKSRNFLNGEELKRAAIVKQRIALKRVTTVRVRWAMNKYWIIQKRFLKIGKKGFSVRRGRKWFIRILRKRVNVRVGGHVVPNVIALKISQKVHCISAH